MAAVLVRIGLRAEAAVESHALFRRPVVKQFGSFVQLAEHQLRLQHLQITYANGTTADDHHGRRGVGQVIEPRAFVDQSGYFPFTRLE